MRKHAFAFVLSVLFISSTNASLIFNESFDGYTLGNISGKGSSVSDGYYSSSSWEHSTGTYYVHESGLSLPSNFAGTAAKGNSAGNFHNDTKADDVRNQYRPLNSSIWTGVSDFYFRVLINASSGALDKLNTSSDNSYYAIGIGDDKMRAINNTGMTSAENHLSFFIRRVEISKYNLYFRHTNQRSEELLLVENFQPDTTYICVAGVERGVGNAANLKVFAATVASNPEVTAWTLTDIATTLPNPVAICMGGNYGVGGNRIYYDEIAIGTTVSDVITANEDAPVVTFVELVRDWQGLYSVTGLVASSESCSIIASASDGTGAPPTTFSLPLDAYEVPYEIALTGLAADKSYSVSVMASNDMGFVVKEAGALYNGALSIAFGSNASENEYLRGTVTVSRASADNVALPVYYSFSGTGANPAVEDINYETPLGVVEIPAGSASAAIEIVPLVGMPSDADTTLEVSLTDGMYTLPAVNTVAVTIADLQLDSEYNYWLAQSAGLASDADNWSQGAPVAGQKIQLGEFSTADMTWDVPVIISEWLQTDGYVGTVMFTTTYPDGAYPEFKITGNCTVDGGTWTHGPNSDFEVNRLSVSVGGDLIIGSEATVDVVDKGYATGKYPSGSIKGAHASASSISGNPTHVYGNLKVPASLGSGGDKGAGGGAICFNVTGSTIMDGTISAASTGGAAGSIYLKTASLSGTGYFLANVAASFNNSQYVAGSGGRIAIELTQAVDLGMDLAQFNTKTFYNGRGSGGSGTIFVKTANQTNGSLYIQGNERTPGRSYVRLAIPFYNQPAIPQGEIWTLDSIRFINGSGATLIVPEDTSLLLPSGFLSVSGDTSGAGFIEEQGVNTNVKGIIYDGGSIVVPEADTHIFSSNWVFQANSPFTIDGNVVIKDSGRIGTISTLYVAASVTNQCILNVNGNLTLESTGRIDATCGGWSDDSTVFGGGSIAGYGGIGGVDVEEAFVNTTYGSILNPVLPGSRSKRGDAGSLAGGGGAVILNVSGSVVLDGTATSTSYRHDNTGGSGGAINITCASISGSGIIDVGGTKSSYSGRDGGGGRVAVRLTENSSTFEDFGLAKIITGRTSSPSGWNVNQFASPGTIYMQAGNQAEGFGTVFICNSDGNLSLSPTFFPSIRADGLSDDFANASLSVEANAKVKIAADVKIKNLVIDDSSVMDLAGFRVTAASAVVAGIKLAGGEYSEADLAIINPGHFADSSATSTGLLKITGSATMIVIR